jgi:hypothetical protein
MSRPAGRSLEPTPARRYQAARATAMEAEATLKRLAQRERQGQLLDRGVVERRVADLARRFRAALEAWPAQVAADLAARLGVDAGVLVGELERRVAAFLRELADERGTFERPRSLARRRRSP